MTITNTTNSNVVVNLLTGVPSRGIADLRKVYARDEFVCVAADINAVGATMLLAPIPSNAIFTNLFLATDALDSNASKTLAFNVGFYTKDQGNNIAVPNSGADSIIVSALAPGGALAWTDEGNQAARTIDKIPSPVWKLAGYTTDPNKTLFVGIGISTAAATAAPGKIAFQLEYLANAS